MTPKVFLVGGAVRDQLLGREPKDFDYVVVGADFAWMQEQGFKQVGKGFPVFLHPVTCDEYALARRETKTGVGYKGFEFEFGPEVTLEEDLGRRDLTINSVASFKIEGKPYYVDPYNGILDLNNKIIRHTSDAFAEDPLRVLRVSRFIARYNFTVAPETMVLCKQLVASGEIDNLSADRVWIEIEKLFSEDRYDRGIWFLKAIGALDTARLQGLIDPYFIPASFNCQSLAEKMYFALTIHTMTKDELNKHKIPLDLAREIKFIASVSELTAMSEFASVEIEHVIACFDTFRTEFKAKKHNQLTGADEISFIKWLDAVTSALLNLNFAEMTKGLPVDEIKRVVFEAKKEAIDVASAKFNEGE